MFNTFNTMLKICILAHSWNNAEIILIYKERFNKPDKDLNIPYILVNN